MAALRPVVDDGLWWVAVAAALNVALGLAYYLRWTALLVARPHDGDPPPTWDVSPAEGSRSGSAASCSWPSASCRASWCSDPWVRN